MDRDEMLRALGAFADEGLEYVLIGAAAMGVHGIVRATEDLICSSGARPRTWSGCSAPCAGSTAAIRTSIRSAPRTCRALLKRDTVRAIDRQDATALARAFKLDEEP